MKGLKEIMNVKPMKYNRCLITSRYMDVNRQGDLCDHNTQI